MTVTAEGLRMVQLRLKVPGLFGLSRRQKLPARQTDMGYLVHCQLAALFGDLAPKPFLVGEARGRSLDVLGYTNHEAAALMQHARTYAEPAAYDNCDWEHLATKPLPTEWADGHRLGFEARVCPVIRKSSDGEKHRKGAEVDLFLSKCWEAGDPDLPVCREAVYRDWLTARFAASGSARLLEARMIRFQRARLLRRSQNGSRQSTFCERPDATFQGLVEVVDGASFTQLLARGIGRHRSFGFGMLLLRPPGH